MLRYLWINTLAVPLLFAVPPVRAQMTNSTIPAPSAPGIRTNPSPYDRMGSMDPNLMHRQLVARREEARRRMVQNSERLLQLTEQLEADIRTHEPTAEDGKRLDDIAKLARAVRDQMRQ